MISELQLFSFFYFHFVHLTISEEPGEWNRAASCTGCVAIAMVGHQNEPHQFALLQGTLLPMTVPLLLLLLPLLSFLYQGERSRTSWLIQKWWAFSISLNFLFFLCLSYTYCKSVVAIYHLTKSNGQSQPEDKYETSSNMRKLRKIGNKRKGGAVAFWFALNTGFIVFSSPSCCRLWYFY